MDVDFVASGLLEDETIEIEDFNDHSNFEGGRCGICMDIVIDRGVLDCCQHWFCFGCIDNWATITNLCPLCQSEFQLITCVPVYDTVGSNKVDEESFSRDDDWCIEEKGNNVSFPSYYIDENAVTCLDGDGCKIRSGSATIEEDSNLDTSIACDSCDLWYHAFCVGFDPEGTSEDTWFCPRCAVDEAARKSDATLVQSPTNECVPESSHGNQLGKTALIGNLSIEVADAGETAVVVSMVGGNNWTGEPSEIFHPTPAVSMDLKVDNCDETSIKAETQIGKTNDIRPILEGKGLELSLSCDTSFSQPSRSLTLSELKISCTNEMNRPRRFGGFKNSLRKLISDSSAGNKQSESHSNMGLHLGLAVGSFLSDDCLSNNGTKDQMTEDVQQQSLPEKSLLIDEKVQPLGVVEEVKITGTKRTHTDARDYFVDIADDEEANDKNEGAASAKKIKAEANLQMAPKDEGKAFLSEESQICSNQLAVEVDKLKHPPEKEDVTLDVMSIVQGTSGRLSKGFACQSPAYISSKERENTAGLRVKKIMRRASESIDSSVVVQKLRKEIREAVRNKSSDIGENLFDPKLLAAFRTAVAGSTTETVEKLSQSAMKAKKSMLQKGKVRENLTKKIYGNSNGRRKRAWDRDCEVEFWKHRCMRATKPEKIATLKSVLNLLKKNPEGSDMKQTSESQPTNPILSRLYLADTSVFPRKDDIKPLSALTTTSSTEQNRAQPISVEKVQKSPPDDRTSKFTEANKTQSKPAVPSGPDKVPKSKGKLASGKAHQERGSEGSSKTPIGASKSNSQKETVIQSDDKKIDKRKWALEVLARKMAVVGKSTGHEEQEGGAALKGNFPLLAQLPADMRPVLAPSRHNKIPVSVRQTQLHRLTEHFLRKTNLSEMRRTAETELAVADAINIEKEVADKSNSKIVYLNLCSQEILHRSDNSKFTKPIELNSSTLSSVPADRSEQPGNGLPTDLAVTDALRNAGLLSDSPPSSPHCKMEIPNEVSNSPELVKEEGPDNILEMDSNLEVDIYGDFEYELDDEDYIGTAATSVSKPPLEEGESRMKVVFSTLKFDSSNDVEDSGNSSNIKEAEEFPSLLKGCIDGDIISSTTEGVTDKSSKPPTSVPSEEGKELSFTECEELYGPDKEPLINKFPEEASNQLGRLVDAKAQAATKISGKSENHASSQVESTSNHSHEGEKVSRKDKSTNDNNKQCDVNFVFKKVEAYIKEHIRPLCKSGVITGEQYRWAVAKTTEKVMKYHLNAKNANFLIKEGEKVKKLAEQYVETAQKKEKVDSL